MSDGPIAHQRRRVGAAGPAALVITLGALCIALISAPPLAAQDQQQTEADAASRALRAADGLYQGGWYRLAAPEYEQFLERWPDHADATIARYALALCRYHLGEHESAAEHLQTVLADDDFAHRDDALALLGYCYLSLGQHERALEPIDQLIENHADSDHFGTALVNRAHALYVLQRFEQAEEAAGAVVEADGIAEAQQAAGLYLRAMAQNRLARHEASQQTIEQLLAMDERLIERYRIDALLLLGQALERQGELEGAAEQFTKMLEDAPEARRNQARYSLAAVLYRQGEYARSIEHLQALLEAEQQRDSPSRYAAPARLQLGIAQLAHEQVDAARSTLEAVLRDDEQRRDRARYWLAQCDMAQQNYQAAREHLDELVEADPGSVNLAAVHFDRALCNAMLDEHETAAAQFAAFIEQFEDDRRIGEARYRQAYSLHRLDRYDDSLALAQQVAGMQGHRFARPAWELAAENLFLTERYDNAARAFAALARAMNEESEQWPVVHLRLGQCAFYQEAFDTAIEWLEKVADDDRIAQRPELHDVLFLLGDARLQQNEYEPAAQALKRYIELSEEGLDEARYKLAMALHRQDEGAAAIEQLNGVVEGSMDSPWVQRAALRLAGLIEPEDAARARGLLERLLDADDLPETLAAPATYRLAWLKLDAGEDVEAADGFAAVAERFSEHELAPDAAYRRALALHRAERHEDALQRYEQYLAAHGGGEHALQSQFRAALCELELGRYAPAAQRLTALLEADGLDDSRIERAQVLYELAWAHRGNGDGEQAIAGYRRIVSDHTDHANVTPARVELAELLIDEGEHEEAVGLLEAAVEDDRLTEPEQRASAMLRLAIGYDRLERDREAGPAWAQFADAFNEHEQAPVARFNAGLAFSRIEALEQAEQQLTRLIEDHGGHELIPRALILRGQVQADANRYPASAESYRQFLSGHEGHELTFRAHFGLGWAHEQQRQFDEARQSYTRVVENHDGPTAARAQFQIGQTHFQQQDYEAAVRELLKVSSVYAYEEWAALALLEAGRAFERLEDPDSARRVYRQLVNGFEDQPPARQARARLDALGEGG